MTAPPTSRLVPPRPRKARLSREEKKVVRTQELLDAAWHLFCKYGYEAVTIDHVAEHAGCSRMPIYSLFGDKQNLFLEIWRRQLAALTETLLEGLKPGQPLRKNLQRLAQKVADSLRAKGELNADQLFFVVQTIALSRADIAAKHQQAANAVVEAFTRMVQEATLGAGDRLRGDARTVAAHIIAHINGLATVKFQTRNAYGSADNLSDIFCNIALKSGKD